MNLYRPVKFGSLELPGNLFLAPVAGYTDRAFRSVCVEAGADFTYTELISSEALIRSKGFSKSEYMLARAENEGRYAIQLFGSDPQVMFEAAALLEQFRPSAVDINGGCPVAKVVKNGAGSALCRDPLRLGAVVAAVVRASEQRLGGVPVSVKIRSGWDSSSINYREIARAAVDAGAALVALHARTKSQGYAGKSDWTHIADLASRLEVPVIGSGDLYSPEDAGLMLRETGAAGVMFARGAMGNPFIFSAAKSYLLTGAYTWPAPREKIAVAMRQLELLAGDSGEKIACLEMRKQFCAYTKDYANRQGRGHGGHEEKQGREEQQDRRQGLSGGRLREALVHAGTIQEYRDILKDFLE